ncbi:MAG: hypothetical protein HY727_16600 [Candidatus Rokubacteria bacterium]|nr:hypothetical protein [Candidatus Rokubacteria bacterium]
MALGWDPRLSRAPRLANVVEGWLDYLECASDADGNIYFCPKFHAVSLDPEFRVRWSLRFECEYLWHPVLTPDGTLLIAGGDTLFAIE